MESKDERKSALDAWLLSACHLRSISLQPIPGDASFRRYFRVYSPEGSFIAMDAPPPHENCAPYIAISKALRELGLYTPEIIYADVSQGFLLITDFGDLTFLKVLNERNASDHYQNALQTLVRLQACRNIPGRALPPFDQAFMWQEWLWHKEWFLTNLLKLSFASEEKNLDKCFASIVESAVNQPQVFMHRDFHSANLMVLPKAMVGVLDFQDAFIGPITYDLVSLLRDCYIDWPNEWVEEWALAYLKKLHELGVVTNISKIEFLRWFDLMGVERHLKALFTFARKAERDKQFHYLKHVPRTLAYLQKVTQRYPELSVLQQFLSQRVLPAFHKETLTCVQ